MTATRPTSILGLSWLGMSLGEREYQFVYELVLEKTGILLQDEKRIHTENQVRACAKSFGFESPQILLDHLRSSHYSKIHRQLIEQLLDTETHFFRHFPVFKYVRKTAFAKLLERNADTKTLNILCAGCSTGQEAYSLSIMLEESAKQFEGWKVRLIAADVSTKVLEQAEDGVYNQTEVSRGLPAPLLLKHFDRETTRWQVKPVHRERVEFIQLNLSGSWDQLPGEWDEPPIFDIVFMREVVSQFEPKARSDLFQKLPWLMHQDAYLVLGKDEPIEEGKRLFAEVEEEGLGIYSPRSKPLEEEAPKPTAPPAEAPPPEITDDAIGELPDNPYDAPKRPAPRPKPKSPSQSQLLVTFQYKDLETVTKVLFKDLSPDAHLFLGIKKQPPQTDQLFNVINVVPKWARVKKKSEPEEE